MSVFAFVGFFIQSHAKNNLSLFSKNYLRNDKGKRDCNNGCNNWSYIITDRKQLNQYINGLCRNKYIYNIGQREFQEFFKGWFYPICKIGVQIKGTNHTDEKSK